MLQKVGVIPVQSHLSSVTVDELLAKFLLNIKQDFQRTTQDCGYPVHSERCSNSRRGAGC